MQLKMNLHSRHQINKAWAFAVDQTRMGLRNHQSTIDRDLGGCVITSSSKEARLMGVYSGMSYDDAKTMVPDLRIMVVN